MNSSNPKPRFQFLRTGVPVVFGASFLGLSLASFRSHAWTGLLVVCCLAAAMIPVARSRGKAAEGLFPLAGTSAVHDGILWEAEVLSPLGEPPTFRLTGVTGDTSETLGHFSAEWLGDSKFWPAHVAVEDRERVLEACRSAIKQGQENLVLEYRMLNGPGQILWIEDSVEVLRAWGGRPRKLRGRMINITKQKQAAEIIRQSQKMEEVGRLVGGAVHDFNNLLTVIGGHADLLLMSMDPMDPRRNSIEEIKKAGGRAATLARQLLAFSRRNPISPQLLDLGLVVGNLSKMLRRLIPENIELATFPRAGLGHILADPGQIEQIIINLVVNARDAMSEGGRLVIETGTCDISHPPAGSPAHPGRYVTFSVRDTGCGMDAATRKRIFEPFFTTKESGKGTGLGLATVHEIVSDRQGYIEVESELGKGTAIRIYFPCTELADAARPASGAAAGARPGFETILLVEDDENVRAMARQLLSAYGYRVREAASAEEALGLAEQHTGSVDLLLTDVVMPRMDGHDLGEILKKRYPDLKVLYMSGYSQHEMLRHAVLGPDMPFIQKPFTPQAMAASVRKVLDGERSLKFGASESEMCRVEASSARPN